MGEVHLRLLGPMELRVDGRSVPLGPARQRTVLAALAVDAARTVPVDTLIARVWDDEPPDGVRSGLYSYVTRLRRVLRAADGVTLDHRAGGYVLDLDPDSVDVLRFGRLTRAATGTPDPSAVEEALGLWRGPALADLAGGWVGRTRQRLEQQRVDAVLGWAAAHLAAGRASVVIDPLRDLAALHPLVEPLAARLIEALYRDGRAAEALDEFAGVRRHLVEELGTEPGTELRNLHAAILRGEAPHSSTSAPAHAVAAARRGPIGTLPADTGAFTGRATEIAQITAAGEGRVLVIHAIAGMPGVGKTALAVHVAHRLRDEFPDGHVFVDLHGYTAGRAPADPGDVLAALLAADGVDPRQLPAGTDARAAHWRDRLAGRRTLVVLDNAIDSAQVAPLLPASPGCLVLVTSRRFLGDLPAEAVPICLDVLAANEAEQMFTRLAPHARAHPAEVAEVVAACGYLPLAVSLLARVLNRHRGWTVADLLTETRARLLDVAAEHASVAAAFGLSYQHLPAERQRFLRRLALHPGTELEPHAAAALSGAPLADATRHLDALQADSLLIEIGYHRYAMHDLIRSYAATLAAGDADGERKQAIDRLLDHYVDAAARADLAWLRAERANLVACLANTTDPRRVVALTAGLTELLRRDGPWTEALILHADAVRAAAELGDRPGQADALIDLGTIRRLSGDYPGGEREMRLAYRLHDESGNRLGAADALTGLGKALSRTSDYAAATDVLQRALDLYRDLGEPPGEAGALVELAVARGMRSDFQGAQEMLRRALDLYRRLGDRTGEAYALRILGIAHGRVGDFAGSRELLTSALELYRHLGGRLGEALSLTDLGRASSGLGDYADAARALRASLDLHRELDHRVGQSTALLYLGGALRRSGDLPGAAGALDDALALNRDIRNRSGEAMVLNEMGAVHRLTGDVDRAMAAHRQALDVAEQVPSPWDRAQSIAGFGRCAVARGRFAEGAAQLREALFIFERISAAEAAEVAAELASMA